MTAIKGSAVIIVDGMELPTFAPDWFTRPPREILADGSIMVGTFESGDFDAAVGAELPPTQMMLVPMRRPASRGKHPRVELRAGALSYEDGVILVSDVAVVEVVRRLSSYSRKERRSWWRGPGMSFLEFSRRYPLE